jgi:hypothetical protein
VYWCCATAVSCAFSHHTLTPRNTAHAGADGCAAFLPPGLCPHSSRRGNFSHLCLSSTPSHASHTVATTPLHMPTALYSSPARYHCCNVPRDQRACYGAFTWLALYIAVTTAACLHTVKPCTGGYRICHLRVLVPHAFCSIPRAALCDVACTICRRADSLQVYLPEERLQHHLWLSKFILRRNPPCSCLGSYLWCAL